MLHGTEYAVATARGTGMRKPIIDMAPFSNGPECFRV